MQTGQCYWRFKGDKEWRYGYVTKEGQNLYRMGLWNGCTNRGSVVSAHDIEIQR